MSEDTAIRVTNLSKSYRLYDNHVDRLKEALNPFGKLYHKNRKVLDNINFEIKKGESIGIIGKNGAGKSTILKTITGVLTPTSGEVQINGRIASLLELGAGFNPEMTGYENINFNASLLGLSDDEINNRLDSILSFADIGEYIYQPVKTYSSGMYVRLAFAINVAIEPDILIIDEALAVGDAVFVQKCMRYIRDFMKHGTLLFVSHDIASIKNLCTSVIWLDNGIIKKIGNTEAVCNNYLDHSYGALNSSIIHNSAVKNIQKQEKSNNVELIDNYHGADGWHTEKGQIIAIDFYNEFGERKYSFDGGEKVKLVINAIAEANLNNPILGFIVKDRLGQELFGENTIAYTKEERHLVTKGQKISAEFIFNMPILQNGEYAMMVSFAEGDNYVHTQHHYLHDAYIISVQSEKIKFGIMSIKFDSVILNFEG